MSNKNNKRSDLQGLTNLFADATLGVTNLVETVQRQIVHPPFLPSTPIQRLITNIASIPYNNIKRSTRFFAGTLGKASVLLNPVFEKIGTTVQKEVVRSVINGIIGDYLEEKDNPLKIRMQFRYRSKAIAIDSQNLKKMYPTINGKILLMVHGVCMNDILWTRRTHDHGEALAKELGKTPIYLNYNSGRHISSNGQSFNELLEELVLNWPVPVEELVIIGHSMGGLVTRSALHYGQQQNKTWPNHLKKIFFLGTPHHGASLERTGNYVDVILQSIYYLKPFARLGKIRSAGLTDLRYGNVIDEDWQGKDRFEMSGDQRQSIPLPKLIECYSIAAVLGKAKDAVSSQILGDGLVDLNSALGKHKNLVKDLRFKKKNTYIAYENGHLDLLNSPKVYSALKNWLVLTK